MEVREKVGYFDSQTGKSQGIVREFFFAFGVLTLLYAKESICLISSFIYLFLAERE